MDKATIEKHMAELETDYQQLISNRDTFNTRAVKCSGAYEFLESLLKAQAPEASEEGTNGDQEEK